MIATLSKNRSNSREESSNGHRATTNPNLEIGHEAPLSKTNVLGPGAFEVRPPAQNVTRLAGVYAELEAGRQAMRLFPKPAAPSSKGTKHNLRSFRVHQVYPVLKPLAHPTLDQVLLDDAVKAHARERGPQVLSNPHPDLPPYIEAFAEMLYELEDIFTALYQQTPVCSLFHKLFHDLWRGERNNAGVARARERLAEPQLLKTLGLEQKADLVHYTPKQFFQRFVQRRFMVEVNRIARLYLLYKIPSQMLNVRQTFERDGIDGSVIADAYRLLDETLSRHFDVHLRTVNLFQDDYNAAHHNKAPAHTNAIKILFPQALEKIAKLQEGKIYEIFSVGYEAPRFSLDVKPLVLYK